MAIQEVDRYDSLIQYWSEHYGLDWTHTKRQLMAESDMHPEAVSRVGAKGLAQFMPATWDDLASRQGWPTWASPFNPEYAIRANCIFMHWLLSLAKGDFKLALAMYNWGPGNVAKHPDPKDWPQETKDYVAKIAGP